MEQGLAQWTVDGGWSECEHVVEDIALMVDSTMIQQNQQVLMQSPGASCLQFAQHSLLKNAMFVAALAVVAENEPAFVLGTENVQSQKTVIPVPEHWA